MKINREDVMLWLGQVHNRTVLDASKHFGVTVSEIWRVLK